MSLRSRLAHHGFRLQSTGGNCTAYVRTDGTVEEYITMATDPMAPRSLSDHVTVSAWGDGEEFDVATGYTMAQVLSALDAQRREVTP